MDTDYTYTCPNCSKECSVAESSTGLNVVCPQCSSEFFATPPEGEAPPVAQTGLSNFSLPAKLPFFKSGRRKILEQRLDQLIANYGALDLRSEEELNKIAIELGLQADEGSKVIGEHFMEEFEPIKHRMESALMMTDDDAAAIEDLEKKYQTRLTLEGVDLFRAIYLLEAKGTLPAPIRTDLMLNRDEVAYYAIETCWHQPHVHTTGYSGTSVSLPVGIKGVRFRFGGYTPSRIEEITPLSNGILYVTSERLFFNGESKNTTITLKRIIDGHVFSDSLKIEKSSGKPDYFSMQAAHARLILSLVGVLK